MTVPWETKVSPIGPSLESVTDKSKTMTSVHSLTPSQLNEAMVEMLNLNPNASGFQKFCQGNPITTVGKRFQLLRLIGTVMIPIIVLVSMVGHIFGNRIKEHLLGQDVQVKIRYSLELSQMMHTLQIERDMSALYISSIIPETKSYLVLSYPDTDEALEGLSRWSTIGDTQLKEFWNKENFLNYLNHHRYTLDTTKPTITEELDFYSSLMREFMQWFYDAIMEARSGMVWKDLVSLQEVVEAREAFGIERALGTIFFMTGSFVTMEDYLRYVESQDIANVTLNSARKYSVLVDQIYKSTFADIDRYIGGIQHIRFSVRQAVLEITEPSLGNAILWYDNMTAYLDALLSMQNRLSNLILDQLRDSERSDAETVIIVAILFTVVLFMCPLILNAIYSLMSNIQRFSVILANRSRALTKEKKRTDILFYQMLPKCIVKQMRQNEEVRAEIFEEVTLLFSAIVSFTTICAQSSPMQIVNMLNNLSTCFDHYISLHDIYKLDTIGNTYLLASGLPKWNGDNHVKEIATIAIELLDKVSSLETPHMPGTFFRIRIGCHSGSVLTGIVGRQMPRYCVFGETLGIASKVACTGKASRIHISQAMQDLLQKLGGYVTVEREDAVASIAGPTYWLVHEHGKARNSAIYDSYNPLKCDKLDVKSFPEDGQGTPDEKNMDVDFSSTDSEIDNPFILGRKSTDVPSASEE